MAAALHALRHDREYLLGLLPPSASALVRLREDEGRGGGGAGERRYIGDVGRSSRETKGRGGEQKEERWGGARRGKRDGDGGRKGGQKEVKLDSAEAGGCRPVRITTDDESVVMGGVMVPRGHGSAGSRFRGVTVPREHVCAGSQCRADGHLPELRNPTQPSESERHHPDSSTPFGFERQLDRLWLHAERSIYTRLGFHTSPG
eukprot:89012-Chlamydomonas_euryale.AAC.1